MIELLICLAAWYCYDQGHVHLAGGLALTVGALLAWDLLATVRLYARVFQGIRKQGR